MPPLLHTSSRVCHQSSRSDRPSYQQSRLKLSTSRQKDTAKKAALLQQLRYSRAERRAARASSSTRRWAREVLLSSCRRKGKASTHTWSGAVQTCIDYRIRSQNNCMSAEPVFEYSGVQLKRVGSPPTYCFFIAKLDRYCTSLLGYIKSVRHYPKVALAETSDHIQIHIKHSYPLIQYKTLPFVYSPPVLYKLINQVVHLAELPSLAVQGVFVEGDRLLYFLPLAEELPSTLNPLSFTKQCMQLLLCRQLHPSDQQFRRAAQQLMNQSCPAKRKRIQTLLQFAYPGLKFDSEQSLSQLDMSEYQQLMKETDQQKQHQTKLIVVQNQVSKTDKQKEKSKGFIQSLYQSYGQYVEIGGGSQHNRKQHFLDLIKQQPINQIQSKLQKQDYKQTQKLNQSQRLYSIQKKQMKELLQSRIYFKKNTQQGAKQKQQQVMNRDKQQRQKEQILEKPSNMLKLQPKQNSIKTIQYSACTLAKKEAGPSALPKPIKVEVAKKDEGQGLEKRQQNRHVEIKITKPAGLIALKGPTTKQSMLRGPINTKVEAIRKEEKEQFSHLFNKRVLRRQRTIKEYDQSVLGVVVQNLLNLYDWLRSSSRKLSLQLLCLLVYRVLAGDLSCMVCQEDLLIMESETHPIKQYCEVEFGHQDNLMTALEEGCEFDTLLNFTKGWSIFTFMQNYETRPEGVGLLHYLLFLECITCLYFLTYEPFIPVDVMALASDPHQLAALAKQRQGVIKLMRSECQPI